MRTPARLKLSGSGSLPALDMMHHTSQDVLPFEIKIRSAITD